MFKDYYLILGTTIEASPHEIKQAFIRQAKRWHPDKNLGKDTTAEMQDINEAYLILRDSEARQRYDAEYRRYKGYDKGEPFELQDETLKRWMQNARKQAVELAIQTMKEVAVLTKVGFKEAGTKSFEYFIAFFISGVLLSIIFGLSRGCS